VAPVLVQAECRYEIHDLQSQEAENGAEGACACHAARSSCMKKPGPRGTSAGPVSRRSKAG